MKTLHILQPATLDFFETAPLRVRCTMVAKCTPEVIFETLRGDSVWTEWAGVIQKVEWTSNAPIAKDSTRDVSLVGDMLVKEVFFHWEENERVAFYVTESTIPNLTKFAEDYAVERVSPNETRLTWTVAIENAGFMRYLNPVMPLVLKPIFQAWFGRYKRVLEARASSQPESTVARSAAS